MGRCVTVSPGRLREVSEPFCAASGRAASGAGEGDIRLRRWFKGTSETGNQAPHSTETARAEPRSSTARHRQRNTGNLAHLPATADAREHIA